MRNLLHSICGALLVSACGGDDNTLNPVQMPVSGTNAASTAGTTSAGAPAGGGSGMAMIPTSGRSAQPMTGGTGAPGVSGAPAAAGGMAAVSGTGGPMSQAGTGSTAGTGATDTAGAGGAAGMLAPKPASPGVPKIPEPKGECPKFMSGTITFAGLRMQIQAGTPGETKGSLLFAWHATAGTAGAAMSGVPASVRDEITKAGGLVVAPQGNVGGADRTDIAPPTGAWFIEDLDTADEVVACAVKNHNIDPNRIYATGCSAGGLMSGTFGLMRSQYVAAVAPNSGGINYMNSRKLSDMTHGPAAFLMHGGGGDNVIVNFQDTSHWFEDQNKLAANKPFMIECNHMIGHCGAPSSLHVSAWEFMKAHPYNVGASPWAMSAPSNLASYCKVVQ
jgi:hypothetical protein